MTVVANKITVYSGHPVMVAGFRALIAEPAGLAVSVCSEPDDLRACLAAGASDLVLIDASIGMNLEFLREIRLLAPGSGLILWVDVISPELVREVIGCGVRGVLRKDATLDLCFQCLGRVQEGQLWLENEMSQEVLSAKTVRLSPRERQLVGLLTEGLRNKEIAWRMRITEGTAKAYLSRLYQKTGAGDRFELALFVLKNLEVGHQSLRSKALASLNSGKRFSCALNSGV